MPADSERDPLPFEPTRKRRKPQKEANSASAKVELSKATPKTQPDSRSKLNRDDVRVPEVVSRRMLRRMVFFSGVPVVLGISVFFASYVIIVQKIAVLPNVAVLLTTLGCFGLSVVGLSYGALSASWDEDAVGGLVGFDQFKLNASRMVGSWRQAQEQRRNDL